MLLEIPPQAIAVSVSSTDTTNWAVHHVEEFLQDRVVHIQLRMSNFQELSCYFFFFLPGTVTGNLWRAAYREESMAAVQPSKQSLETYGKPHTEKNSLRLSNRVSSHWKLVANRIRRKIRSGCPTE